MFFLLSVFMLIIILVLSFFLLESNLFFLKNINKTEIECGIFNMFNNNSGSFFYILFMMVFMVFDMEIILLFSLINKMMFNFYFMLVSIISLSLIMELFDCSIKWND